MLQSRSGNFSLPALSKRVPALPKLRQESRMCHVLPFFEFVDTLCQFPRAAPVFGVSSCFLSTNLISLLRFTRRRAQVSIFPQQPPILLRHFSLTFYWAAQQPQCVEKYTCHHTCIRIQTSDSSTQGGARSHTTVRCTLLQRFFYTVFCLSILKDFPLGLPHV